MKIFHDFPHVIGLRPGFNHGDDFHRATAVAEQRGCFFNLPYQVRPCLLSRFDPLILRFYDFTWLVAKSWIHGFFEKGSKRLPIMNPLRRSFLYMD